MMAFRSFGFLIALVLLSGCARTSSYNEPVVPTITLASDTTALLMTGDPAQAWWLFLDDPVLNQRIETALQHNSDIRVAAARLRASRAHVDEQRSEQWPTVNTRAGYSRSRMQQPGAGDSERVTLDHARLGFDMAWELDLFGRLLHLNTGARARAQAAEADLQQVRLMIAADVARYHYQLLGLQQQLTVAADQVKTWQETIGLINARLQQGSALPEELDNAETQRARSEAAVSPLTTALQQTRYRLDVLMGNRPGSDSLTTTVLPTTPLIRQLPLGDVDSLIRHRPDVLAAERLLAASSADADAIRAERYPRLDLNGFIGFFALRGSDPGSASRAWEIAPQISWPGLNSGRLKARIRSADAQIDSTYARYEQTLLVAQEEVESALTGVQQQQLQLVHLLRAATHSEAALEGALARYRYGATSYANVLENQRALFEIKQAIAQVEAESFVGIVALYKALGWGMEVASKPSVAQSLQSQ